MLYYIGIDWGLKKTGLAIADDELKIATILPEIKTVDLVMQISKLQKEYDKIKIVFGSLEQIKHFKTGNNYKLQIVKQKVVEELKKLGLKVVYFEEMLSTKIAQQNLLESGKKKVSKKDNSESAKIILQDYLDNLGQIW